MKEIDVLIEGGGGTIQSRIDIFLTPYINVMY